MWSGRGGGNLGGGGRGKIWLIRLAPCRISLSLEEVCQVCMQRKYARYVLLRKVGSIHIMVVFMLFWVSIYIANLKCM